ncbi:hypothetical protein MTR_5g090960 [Medicago truncatula]|uniref:Uncharacterized protein n=1 Tax=Medicago truncatula TaxID=3880 RepID=G7K3B5_MEDTR|nr:hypothetical protein MTR_5g090960 [Medicago truncatula]
MLDPPQPIKQDWSDTAFEKMNRLRILIVRNKTFSSEPKHLPNQLRLLEWDEYPSKSFPDIPSATNGRSTLKTLHFENSGLSDQVLTLVVIPPILELFSIFSSHCCFFRHFTVIAKNMNQKLHKILS